jgi:peptidoglycan/xylan/chitin deacetylase (PgdA/CDA1 family)
MNLPYDIELGDKLKTIIEKWNGRYDYLSLRKPTRSVLDLLDEYEVTATFFVVADVVDHYPGLVESIAERGHEIGCHGLHQKLTFVNFIEIHRWTQIDTDVKLNF